MSWSAKIEGYEQIVPELRVAVRLGLKDGLGLLMVEGVRMVQENIATPYEGKPAAVAFGNLIRGVQGQVVDTDPLMTLVIGEGSSLGADKYAAPVETGAKAHMPPSSALILWVKKKFGAETLQEAKSMAYVVARSIAKKGTHAHRMFERGLVSLEKIAVPTLEKSIATRLAAAGFTGAE